MGLVILSDFQDISKYLFHINQAISLSLFLKFNLVLMYADVSYFLR